MNITKYFNFFTKPGLTFRKIIDSDNGRLLMHADILFLINALIQGIQFAEDPIFWEATLVEKIISIVFLVIVSYVGTRYIFSFIIFKITQQFNKDVNLAQIRFIFSHSLIPLILLSSVMIIRVFLIYNDLDNMTIIYIEQALLLIGFVLLIRILIAGLQELIKLNLWQSIVVASPLTVVLILNFYSLIG